jgi:hypothetical protein
MMYFSFSVWYTYEYTENSHSDLLHVFHNDQVYVSRLMLPATTVDPRRVGVSFRQPARPRHRISPYVLN